MTAHSRIIVALAVLLGSGAAASAQATSTATNTATRASTNTASRARVEPEPVAALDAVITEHYASLLALSARERAVAALLASVPRTRRQAR